MSSEEGPVLPFPIQVPNVDQALTPERRGIISQLEALLFAAGEPVGEQTLTQALARDDVPEVRRCLQLFQADQREHNELEHFAWHTLAVAYTAIHKEVKGIWNQTAQIESRRIGDIVDRCVPTTRDARGG